MSELVLHLRDQGRTSSVTVSHLPFHIGREKGNDLELTDASVSRWHARIERNARDQLVIFDNQSRNGVYVNRVRIGSEQKIHQNDTLHIGSVRMEVGALEIQQETQGRETLTYVAHEESWDPATTLSGALPKKGVRQPLDLARTIDLLLAAPLPSIYDRILDTVEDILDFDRCYLVLLGPDGLLSMDIVAQRDRTSAARSGLVSRDILGQVASQRKSVIVTLADTNFEPTESFIRTGAASALCVPLTVQERVVGVLYLDRPSGAREFTPADVETLGPLVGLIALKVEFVRLHETEVEAQRIRRDLELAQEVQTNLLPKEVVQLEGYEIDGYSSPCQAVGGDCFDFHLQDDGALTTIIGDVSGKGLSAALHMAGLLSTARAHLHHGVEPETLMQWLDGHTRKTFRPNEFVTLCVARLTGPMLRYANSGHPAPLLVDPAGEVEPLLGHDPALNLIPDWNYESRERSLNPGDLVFFYTDGLNEAVNPAGEQYGTERIVEFLRRHRDAPLDELRRELLRDVDLFCEHLPPDDDLTFVVLRREGV